MEKRMDYTAALEEVSWNEARPAFVKNKPRLTELIDERKPDKRYNLIRARYPYGAFILKDGIFYLPNNKNEVVPISHPTIDDVIRDQLAYSDLPLGLITHNATEVSREMAGNVFSLRFFLPGIIMGLWESLDRPRSHLNKQTWTVTAGARSIFTLPKIQAAANYARLKKRFNLPYQVPKEIFQQWHMFKHIANHPDFNHPWYQELYFFPKKWLHDEPKDIDRIKFHHFLLEEVWQLSEYARNARDQDVTWDFFASILSSTGYKPNPLHIDILKHIIAIALGEFPGVRAAGKSEMAAPVKGFQEVLLDSYNLKQYVPTIMHPYHFSIDDIDESPVYYSYQVPNMLNSLPTLKNPISTFSELLSLHDLMDQFLQAAISGNLKIENTLMADMLRKVNFAYFHSDATGSYRDKILNTCEMPKNDPALIQLDTKYGERQFAACAHFTRGCIRISKK